VGLLALLPLTLDQLSNRGELVPSRRPFLEFPMQVKGWSGTSFALETRYIEVLRFDDYVLADYQQPHEAPVNLYVAYYRSQRKGQSAHSPQTCIPGGGWEITSIDPVQLRPTDAGQVTRPANRALIQKGDQRQVVLYWFKQRERIVANEYLVKLYVLWDAIARRRTDGALIRLTTPIQHNESEESAEHRLLQLAQDIDPFLTQHIPD
jgi:EpsI family protein